MSDITSEVQKELATLCQCSVSGDNIALQSFACFDQHDDSVSYRAQLVGDSAISADELLYFINSWILSGPIIRVAGVLMRMDSACTAAISDFSDDECFNKTDTSSSQTDVSGPIVGGVVAVIVILVVTVTIVIIIVFLLIKRRAHHDHLSINRGEEYVYLKQNRL